MVAGRVFAMLEEESRRIWDVAWPVRCFQRRCHRFISIHDSHESGYHNVTLYKSRVCLRLLGGCTVHGSARDSMLLEYWTAASFGRRGAEQSA